MPLIFLKFSVVEYNLYQKDNMRQVKFLVLLKLKSFLKLFFCKLLKELEWYRSADTTKATYDKAAKEFIAKWLRSSKAKELNQKSKIIARFEDLIKELKEGE